MPRNQELIINKSGFHENCNDHNNDNKKINNSNDDTINGERNDNNKRRNNGFPTYLLPQ